MQYREGMTVQTMTGELATIIDVNDGRNLFVYIAGAGSLYLHSSNVRRIIK